MPQGWQESSNFDGGYGNAKAREFQNETGAAGAMRAVEALKLLTEVASQYAAFTP